MSAETWVRILFTYGPFAILVLLVFVTEAKLRHACKDKDAPPDQKRVYIAMYALNWVAIFGLVIYSSYAWARTNLRDEQTIRGKVERLTGVETLATSSANLYFRKVRVAGLRYDYEWLLITPKKLDPGYKVNITVDPSSDSGGEADITDYDLTIKSDFYEREVRIFYDAGQKKMFVDLADKVEELPRRVAPLAAPVQTADAGGQSRSLFGTVAHAQSPAQQQGIGSADIVRALESPDALVRRNGRAELARLGRPAVPWIDEVLAKPESSYRLKLGAIVALNNMRGLRADALRPASVEAIRKAADDSDEALRNEARAFLDKYQSALSVVVVYEHYGFDGKAQGFQPGTYTALRGELGELPNDSASSLRVARDYVVKLCDNEGSGKGGSLCESYGGGDHQLKGGVADRVSYIQVFKRP